MFDTAEIYISYCGCECPCPEKKCPNCGEEDVCLLEDPWFNCDDFQSANLLDICAAEVEIEDLEEEEENEEEE